MKNLLSIFLCTKPSNPVIFMYIKWYYSYTSRTDKGLLRRRMYLYRTVQKDTVAKQRNRNAQLTMSVNISNMTTTCNARCIAVLALYMITMSFPFAAAYQLPERRDLDSHKLQCNDLEIFTKDSVSNSYGMSQSHFLNRRSIFTSVITCVGYAAVDGAGLLTNNIANAVDVAGSGIIRSKGCYQGTGDGCTEMSNDNPLIQRLQQQSVKNRERNEKEALYAYYMKNYPDFFNSIGQVMIKKSSDNTFLLVTPQEAERLKGLGKLSYEVPKTLGGTIVDYTQKPILVLKE